MGNKKKLERLFVEFPECLGYGEFVDGSWKYYKQSDSMLVSVEDAVKYHKYFLKLIEIDFECDEITCSGGCYFIDFGSCTTKEIKRITKQALRICKIWRLLNVN